MMVDVFLFVANHSAFWNLAAESSVEAITPGCSGVDPYGLLAEPRARTITLQVRSSYVESFCRL
jgi:hypothetical protein